MESNAAASGFPVGTSHFVCGIAGFFFWQPLNMLNIYIYIYMCVWVAIGHFFWKKMLIFTTRGGFGMPTKTNEPLTQSITPNALESYAFHHFIPTFFWYLSWTNQYQSSKKVGAPALSNFVSPGKTLTVG